MIPLPKNEITPHLRALFDVDFPAGVRCQAVLNGDFPGTLYTDDPANPTWGVVHETVYGTFYPVGQITAPLLAEWVEIFQQSGEVLVGLWPDDPLFDLMPPGVVYDGRVFDCIGRPVGQGLEKFLSPVPEACTLQRVTLDNYARSADYESHMRFFGTPEHALANLIAYLLMRGGDVVCEANAMRLLPDLMEVGVATAEDFQGRGYATLTCAHVIQACEAAGCATYWNCNAQNLPSVALARKLGYRRERLYRLLAWEPQ